MDGIAENQGKNFYAVNFHQSCIQMSDAICTTSHFDRMAHLQILDADLIDPMIGDDGVIVNFKAFPPQAFDLVQNSQFDLIENHISADKKQ